MERPLSFGEQMLIQMMDSMGGAQVLSQWAGALIGNVPAVVAGQSLDMSRVLAGLPAHEVRRWQAMMDLVLPGNYPAQRLRTLMVCDICALTP